MPGASQGRLTSSRCLSSLENTNPPSAPLACTKTRSFHGNTPAGSSTRTPQRVTTGAAGPCLPSALQASCPAPRPAQPPKRHRTKGGEVVFSGSKVPALPKPHLPAGAPGPCPPVPPSPPASQGDTDSEQASQDELYLGVISGQLQSDMPVSTW